ncbi:hypothetical protein SAMN05444165_0193 [Paraburkholderia phenazinium]|jgi:membrane protease YdiL (CAAX protease family)|uniref:CAAX prenyl protease 2/Lysostaphin resistance protein A-like domain-containing protein n=2 Tax=Paraburkholderia phenazinium TaxID=60549 RepID=A0A1N6FGU2_9BURK|nr:hypothetical protein SAMN05444165_0193 [Paraburkholderia phenazinium]
MSARHALNRLPGLLKIVVIAAFSAVLIDYAAAAGSTGFAVDELRVPDHISDAVLNGEKSAYEHALDAYREALLQHPADASLALAECKFIERFASAEDLAWSDAAGKDFDACETTLDKQFSSDPEAALFVLEHRFGAQAVAYGEPLVKVSNNWSTTQRVRLHAALSHGYEFAKNDTRAGQEALIAVQLDPGNERVIAAMRYLVQTKRVQDASKLLAAAPVASNFWQETGRIKAATELLPGTEARDELRRAQHAGLKIDAYTTARALQHVGDSAGAEAVLSADAASRKFESPQNQQLRLDVAFDAGNAKAAADVIHDQYTKTQNATALTGAYARLLDLDPAMIGRTDLRPLTFGLLFMLALTAAAPGMLLFPAHYRGTVRQRIGKTSMPLFGRIGLRHGWIALSIYFGVLYFVTDLHAGTASLSPTGSGVLRMDWQSRLATTYLWAVVFCALGLAWAARLLTWRDWLGGGRWKRKWFVWPAILLGFALLHPAVSLRGITPKVPPSGWPVALVHGAESVGGIALALFVLSVLVPIVEELVFRGCLLGGLSRHISFGWANLLQALLFAAMHRDVWHFGYLFAMGAVSGWLVKKTKGLSMSILLHALNNAIFVFTVVP